MDELWKIIINNDFLLIVFIAAFVLVCLTVMVIYIFAFIQGRSISFWPPKIGDRPKQNEIASQYVMQTSGKGNNDAEVPKKLYEPSYDSRKIVGILLTYTWKKEGDIFPVREGKNFIGSGKIKSIYGDLQCDPCVPDDPLLSSEHALILCRHGTHEITDLGSRNGTYLNGQMLIINSSNELHNYAEIRTGSTVWTYIRLTDQNALRKHRFMEIPKGLEKEVKKLIEKHPT